MQCRGALAQGLVCACGAGARGDGSGGEASTRGDKIDLDRGGEEAGRIIAVRVGCVGGGHRPPAASRRRRWQGQRRGSVQGEGRRTGNWCVVGPAGMQGRGMHGTALCSVWGWRSSGQNASLVGWLGDVGWLGGWGTGGSQERRRRRRPWVQKRIWWARALFTPARQVPANSAACCRTRGAAARAARSRRTIH